MSKTAVSTGPSLMSILFIVFLILKLTNVITWSWWFVTMPLWIGLAILAIVIIIILLAGLVVFGVGLINK